MKFLTKLVIWFKIYKLQVKEIHDFGEEHCVHDGSEPWCDRCAAFFNPW